MTVVRVYAPFYSYGFARGVLFDRRIAVAPIRRLIVIQPRLVRDAADAHDGRLVARVTQTRGIFLQRGLDARGLVDDADPLVPGEPDPRLFRVEHLGAESPAPRCDSRVNSRENLDYIPLISDHYCLLLVPVLCEKSPPE